jgi:hypothetical protein
MAGDKNRSLRIGGAHADEFLTYEIDELRLQIANLSRGDDDDTISDSIPYPGDPFVVASRLDGEGLWLTVAIHHPTNTSELRMNFYVRDEDEADAYVKADDGENKARIFDNIEVDEDHQAAGYGEYEIGPFRNDKEFFLARLWAMLEEGGRTRNPIDKANRTVVPSDGLWLASFDTGDYLTANLAITAIGAARNEADGIYYPVTMTYDAGIIDWVRFSIARVGAKVAGVGVTDRYNGQQALDMGTATRAQKLNAIKNWRGMSRHYLSDAERDAGTCVVDVGPFTERQAKKSWHIRRIRAGITFERTDRQDAREVRVKVPTDDNELSAYPTDVEFNNSALTSAAYLGVLDAVEAVTDAPSLPGTGALRLIENEPDFDTERHNDAKIVFRVYTTEATALYYEGDTGQIRKTWDDVNGGRVRVVVCEYGNESDKAKWHQRVATVDMDENPYWVDVELHRKIGKRLVWLKNATLNGISKKATSNAVPPVGSVDFRVGDRSADVGQITNFTCLDNWDDNGTQTVHVEVEWDNDATFPAVPKRIGVWRISADPDPGHTDPTAWGQDNTTGTLWKFVKDVTIRDEPEYAAGGTGFKRRINIPQKTGETRWYIFGIQVIGDPNILFTDVFDNEAGNEAAGTADTEHPGQPGTPTGRFRRGHLRLKTTRPTTGSATVYQYEWAVASTNTFAGITANDGEPTATGTEQCLTDDDTDSDGITTPGNGVAMPLVVSSGVKLSIPIRKSELTAAGITDIYPIVRAYNKYASDPKGLWSAAGAAISVAGLEDDDTTTPIATTPSEPSSSSTYLFRNEVVGDPQDGHSEVVFRVYADGSNLATLWGTTSATTLTVHVKGTGGSDKHIPTTISVPRTGDADDAAYLEVTVRLQTGKVYEWVANVARNEGDRVRVVAATPPITFTAGAGSYSYDASGMTATASVTAIDPRHSEVTISFTQPATPILLKKIIIEGSYDDFATAAIRETAENVLDEAAIYSVTGALTFTRLVKHKKSEDYYVRGVLIPQGSNRSAGTVKVTASDSISTGNDDGGDDQIRDDADGVSAPSSGNISRNHIVGDPLDGIAEGSFRLYMDGATGDNTFGSPDTGFGPVRHASITLQQYTDSAANGGTAVGNPIRVGSAVDPTTGSLASAFYLTTELKAGRWYRWTEAIFSNSGDTVKKTPGATVEFQAGSSSYGYDASVLTSTGIARTAVDGRHSELSITFTQPATPALLKKALLYKSYDNMTYKLDREITLIDEASKYSITGAITLETQVKHKNVTPIYFRCIIIPYGSNRSDTAVLETINSGSTTATPEDNGLVDTAQPGQPGAITGRYRKGHARLKSSVPSTGMNTIYEYEWVISAVDVWTGIAANDGTPVAQFGGQIYLTDDDTDSDGIISIASGGTAPTITSPGPRLNFPIRKRDLKALGITSLYARVRAKNRYTTDPTGLWSSDPASAALTLATMDTQQPDEDSDVPTMGSVAPTYQEDFGRFFVECSDEDMITANASDITNWECQMYDVTGVTLVKTKKSSAGTFTFRSPSSYSVGNTVTAAFPRFRARAKNAAGWSNWSPLSTAPGSGRPKRPATDAIANDHPYLSTTHSGGAQGYVTALAASSTTGAAGTANQPVFSYHTVPSGDDPSAKAETIYHIILPPENDVTACSLMTLEYEIYQANGSTLRRRERLKPGTSVEIRDDIPNGNQPASGNIYRSFRYRLRNMYRSSTSLDTHEGNRGWSAWSQYVRSGIRNSSGTLVSPSGAYPGASNIHYDYKSVTSYPDTYSTG